MVESLQIDSQPTLANPMIPEVVENKKGVELRLPISIPDLAGGSNPTEVLLQFGCYEMGQERTGVHGRIEAFLVFKYGSGRERKDLLSFTRCNIIDDDRRTRFAGKVFKRFSSYGDLPSIYNKNDLTEISGNRMSSSSESDHNQENINPRVSEIANMPSSKSRRLR